MEKVNYSYSTLSLITIINYLKKGYLKRERQNYEYHIKDRDEFLRGIILGFPMSQIVLDNTNKIIVGESIINILLDFFEDKIEISNGISKKIIEDNLSFFEKDSFKRKTISDILKNYHNKKEFRLRFSTLPEEIQENLKNYQLQYVTLYFPNEKIIEEYRNQVFYYLNKYR